MKTRQELKKEFEDKYGFILKLGIDTKEKFEEIKNYYCDKFIFQV